MISSAAVPYVIPFAVFIGLLALFGNVGHVDYVTEQWIRLGVMGPVIAWALRRVRPLDFRVRNWGGSITIGTGIFLIWIGVDLLFPSYRHFWLFQNAVMGKLSGAIEPTARQPLALALRTLRAVAIVPIVEELFWRGWLMRWMIAPDFQKIPLGSYAPVAFWSVAVLFAAEHGPYWDVGLAAGIVFNAWMVRTKSLGDLILAHAMANTCLSAYVMAAGRWEYW